MTDTLCQLSDGIKNMLGIDEVDLDRPLSQIGVDSLNVVEMIIICQQVYTNILDYDAINIDENTTVREIDSQMNSLMPLPA
ncbi:phosphopantetheine-binding protein [Bradyrhizobium sp.]|uniref:phosphopantetheine-binding protein n=1 Tax=Bradyrhizobium sp. TaxID=376 RepID=UPI003C224107